MTIEESRGLYFAGRRGVVGPPELIRLAWDDHSFRESVVFDLSKCIAREGNFSLVFWIDTLKPALAPEQVVELYTQIRDKSRRVELSWRSEFVAAFPQCEALLPPISIDASVKLYFTQLLAHAVDEGNLEAIGMHLQGMRSYGIQLAELWWVRCETVNECAGAFEYVIPGDPDGVPITDLPAAVKDSQVQSILADYQ